MWSGCKVVSVPYVSAVTEMRILLLVMHVCMLRYCEGGRVTAVLVWGTGSVVVLSEGHEYVRGTPGSCIVSSAADVLGMSMVRGMRGVGGVCEMPMCLARGGVRDEGVSG